MAGIIFTIVISIGLPLGGLIYAIYKKSYLPFVLGIIAFVGSQILIRIPILTYLGQNSFAYSMFQVTQPMLFWIALGLSAGIFEELARYVLMRYLMTRKSWQAGFLFGAGHGGIEAVLLVGLAAIGALFSPTMIMQGDAFFIGGIERLFAMVLHIGLSIIVLTGVKQKKFGYVVLAIIIHGAIDALIGIIPMFLPAGYALLVMEVTLAITALAVFSYSLLIRKRGLLT